MFRTVLLFVIFSTISVSVLAQNLPKKLSKQICKCLENNEVTSMENMDPCFEQVMVKNLADMYEHYSVSSIDEMDFDQIGNEVGAELIKNCEYITPYISNPINQIEKGVMPEENLDCSTLKNGEFYYLNLNPITKVNDTTFVTIKDEMFMERMKSGRTYSLLTIDWVHDCKFDLIFNESNDTFKSTLSKKGDKFEYEVIASTATSFTIRLNWKNQEYKFEFYPIK